MNEDLLEVCPCCWWLWASIVADKYKQADLNEVNVETVETFWSLAHREDLRCFI